MSYFKELTHKFEQLGWYSGRSKLQISIEGEFEGFYGKASENWEHKITIESKEVIGTDGETLWPGLKVEGSRFDRVDDVAKKYLDKLNAILAQGK